jgi:hypothetical protein
MLSSFPSKHSLIDYNMHRVTLKYIAPRRYGYHRWAVGFARHEKTLGVYLVWRSPSNGMKVAVDFGMTLLNRDHFTENQTFSRKNVKFNWDTKGKKRVRKRERSNNIKGKLCVPGFVCVCPL